jgi:Asp-tRNA(Asn)/Glu-tRNA(Gln) amidotransferase A subunit family amidase
MARCAEKQRQDDAAAATTAWHSHTLPLFALPRGDTSMTDSKGETYDPREFRGLTFHDVTEKFRDGSDTPRDYLERCIETIAAREPVVKAFAALNEDGAREAADASTARWKDGRTLSAIDGMPVAIKDLLETKDMPTQMGCDAYEGNFPKRDNAAVWALRQAGAVVFGKTVTAELGGSHPGPTTNPYDPARTPGGSSSGSGAAVACGMVPAAIGTQVGGSIIRPAAFCGNIALKPSQGGINRGERQATSMSTHGVHANCIEDMWQVAIEIAARAGGDRGAPGLMGPPTPPAASKPDRLIVVESDGWAILDDASKSAFEILMESLQSQGIELLRRRNSTSVEQLEKAIAGAGDICSAITAWENHWALRNLIDENPDGVSQRIKNTVASAEAMSPEDYRLALLDREKAQATHAQVGGIADAIVTLACPGPAPLWPGDIPGEPLAPRPTGDAIYNYPSSMLFAPVVTVPLMSVGGLPVGLQVMGRQGDDARVTAIARWLKDSVTPVSVD